MPKFKVTFTREVTQTEEIERVIEASSEEVAKAYADQLADEYNSDCPDDVSTIAGAEFSDWDVGFMVFSCSDDEVADEIAEETGFNSLNRSAHINPFQY